MVIDASALLTVLLNEKEREIYEKVFARSERKFICPINALEADMVITDRMGKSGKERLELYLFNSEIDEIPFTSGMQALAFDAWLKYGKGRNKAKLNMGDCCAYATAKALNEPLLYKGGDFKLTDVKSVI